MKSRSYLISIFTDSQRGISSSRWQLMMSPTMKRFWYLFTPPSPSRGEEEALVKFAPNSSTLFREVCRWRLSIFSRSLISALGFLEFPGLPIIKEQKKCQILVLAEIHSNGDSKHGSTFGLKVVNLLFIVHIDYLKKPIFPCISSKILPICSKANLLNSLQRMENFQTFEVSRSNLLMVYG